MASQQKSQEKQQKNEKSIIFQREEFMISLNNDSIPTLRNANFLKPIFNPTQIQQFPKKPPYFTSNPNIFDQLKGKIKLKGIKSPRLTWKNWVENLEKTHEKIWKKVGIFDAIKASTYKINRDIKLIMYLGQKWCFETNTFVFPWGECSITLEDVMILGGFSVFGESVISCFGDRSSEELDMENKLEGCCVVLKRKNYGHLALYKWMKYFVGKGGELEHVACIVMWLSRYVFCTDCSYIDTDVFALAIRLVKGTRIALGCAVLASIYRDLTLLKGKILALSSSGDDCDHGLSLDLWSQLQLVQVWAWERFRTVSPKPFSLAPGEPRIARWHNVRVLKNDSFSSRLDEGFAEELFLWRPYGMYLENWEFPKFYGDEEKWVVIDSEVDEEYLSFATCLRDCKLEGVDCVEKYLPHRVGMQFGLDQDVPDFVPRKMIPNLEFQGIRCYVPPRLLEGDVTVRYLKWWTGASTSCNDEGLIACPSLKSHCRKLNIRFKGMRPQDYLSPPRDEAMQVDSVSSKDILKTELATENLAAAQSPEKSDYVETNQTHISSVLVNDAMIVDKLLPGSEADKFAELADILETELAPVENLASQNHVCLVPDSELIPITHEKIDCVETNQTQVSSLLVVNDTMIVNELLPGPSTVGSTPICAGFNRSTGENGKENPLSEYIDANRIHKERDNDVIMVDTDEEGDDENDNALEPLCKEFEERISLLETKVLTIMAAKSERK